MYLLLCGGIFPTDLGKRYEVRRRGRFDLLELWNLRFWGVKNGSDKSSFIQSVI